MYLCVFEGHTLMANGLQGARFAFIFLCVFEGHTLMANGLQGARFAFIFKKAVNQNLAARLTAKAARLRCGHSVPVFCRPFSGCPL